MDLSLPEEKCPPHAWKRLQDGETVEDRIGKLEESNDPGHRYNAFLARKFREQGQNIDVSVRFRCSDCGAYQEGDLIIEDKLGETKSGNKSAGKRQVLNYVDISRELFESCPVTIYYQNAVRAVRDAPHVSRWGAQAVHEPCP